MILKSLYSRNYEDTNLKKHKNKFQQKVSKKIKVSTKKNSIQVSK
jgi:hypothetical protein